jgi:hypothetical protein
VIFSRVVFELLTQYWQGHLGSTPLTGIWNVNVDLAQSMSVADSKRLKVPFVHFGLITLDDLGFVAGGFSRVYFGKFRNERVALKMLFVIELTPSSVSDFCKEADVLHDLKHPNVIRCMGVSIMPPAVCIVLEYCALGSLYDFLYKPRSGKTKILAGNMRRTIAKSGYYASKNTKSSAYNTKDSSNPILDSSDVEMRNSHYSGRGSANSNQYMEGAEDAAPKSLKEESLAAIAVQWDRIRALCLENATNFPFSALSEGAKPMRGEIPARTSTVADDSPRRPSTAEATSTFLKRLSGRDTMVKEIPAMSPGLKDVPLRSDTGEELHRTDIPLMLLEGLPYVHNLSCRGLLEIMRDITRGLAYLHSRGLMHCDIKSLNFLVTSVSS